jgi:serine acetyltransferase/GT2 family glycosyltransferase
VNVSLVSLVIATHNREESLRQLLADVTAQTFSPTALEVIVVDDESPVPVPADVRGDIPRNKFRLLRVPRGGPGAARDAGARLANGVILIFVDDDMRLAPNFIEAHVENYRPHFNPTVVLGNIQADDEIAAMPLFERYHARQLARFQASVINGSIAPRGVHLCTGNVSMRRRDYLTIGGFDKSLPRSEDRELGIRLEQMGCRFVFGAQAVTHHGSDHRDVSVWRRRNELYGRADLTIAQKHPNTPGIHPWRFWSLIPSMGRPLALATLIAPRLGRVLATMVFGVARLLDKIGAERAAVALTGLTYCLDYFRGLRCEAGSLRAVRPGAVTTKRAPRGVWHHWKEFLQAVRADHDSTRTNRQKYHADTVPAGRLAVNLISKVGFQMLAMYRLMRFFDDIRVPLVPQVISRLIRHLYGAEIHWKARIAPGVSIVHGTGLVLSHAAEVGPGCILFHGVTLGESLHPVTGRIGAPRLGAGVHVGPGATILGPITVGAGSKIMAGTVVMQDVPPRSLVSAPAVQISAREPRPAAAFRTSRAG